MRPAARVDLGRPRRPPSSHFCHALPPATISIASSCSSVWLCEVGGLVERRVALHQLGAGHRGHRHAEQAVRAVAGILARAEVDLHPEESVRRSRSPTSAVESSAPASTILLEANTRSSIFGSRLEKSASRGISQRAVNTGGAVITSSASPPRSRIDLHRRGERVEAFAQPRQAGARRLGELHAAPRAAEQLHAEVFLEALDLVADRGLRDVQLDRRLLERQVARGGLEYA